ncbi:filamentous hemagglutinin family outer membrane protein [Chondrocystis sp. NIES-4102]|nr:filamentous hemagglutinin family outer membrane protein [Chondrocystis sp. NIES-4102]
MIKGFSSVLQIFLYILGSLFLSRGYAIAQVTPDGTVNTQVTQNGNVAEITGGETRGNNLFHSFNDFSIPTGNEAAFNNANDVSNIFSRVTGGNISNIDGLISANGSANLFLINPAGIIFGENASLDVGGSFYASSASNILFEDGEFSATDINNPPLLTVNAPIGLGFRAAPGDIINRSNFGLTSRVINQNLNPAFTGTEFTILESVGLTVDTNQTIALIGGDVILEDAAGITAPGGKVELGGLTQAGEVLINDNGSLTFPEGISRGDVTLTQQSRVKTTADGGGSINVNARRLELSGLSELYAGIAEDTTSPNAQAGDITINATDSVKLIGSGGIENNPGIFEAYDYETAIRNMVGLQANDVNNPNLGRNPKLNSTAKGNSGGITINTNLLQISDRASVVAKTYGEGNTGNLAITANEIQLSGGDILNQVVEGAIGNAGDINIQANSLSAGDSTFIISNTYGKGNAGNITINASKKVILNGINDNQDTGSTQINTQVGYGAEGNGGNLEINTNNFSLLGGSSIVADIGGKGDGGNVVINAQQITFQGTNEKYSQIYNTVENTSQGNGGDITLNTQRLNMSQGSIYSFTRGTGDAGDITLNASQEVLLDGSNDNVDVDKTQINAEVTENGEGNGGKIEINTGNLSLLGGSLILAKNSGTGAARAGDIAINAQERINIEGINGRDAGIYTNSNNGDGGNINITSNVLSLSDTGNISATANSQDILGSGGNIDINSQYIVAFRDGDNDITTKAFNGNGGNINITTESILGIEERPDDNPTTNDLSTSSNLGIDGEISVLTTDVKPTEGTIELPINLIERAETTEQACQANRETTAKNSLVVRGKGGIPVSPDQPLTPQNLIINGEINTASAIAEPINTSIGKIQIARGIKVRENGQVILTAYPTEGIRERLPQGKTNCGQI